MTPKKKAKQIKDLIQRIDEDILIANEAHEKNQQAVWSAINNRDVISVFRETLRQARIILKEHSVCGTMSTEEKEKVRSIQSHKGFHFFILNRGNIETGIRFFKWLLAKLNFFKGISQILSGRGNLANQSLTIPFDDVKSSIVDSILRESLKAQTAHSIKTKPQNSISNSIHKTQNTKSQAKRKSKKQFIGGNI